MEKDHILISIISDHLIPNYLYAKEKIDMFDVFVFITTPQMEARHVSDNFEKALGYEPGEIERVIVDNDNYASITEKLEASDFGKDAEYWINQTGGTKLMSIALYEYFKDFDSHFVYIPIGTNTYYDFESKERMDLTYRMGLKEYLTLYGITAVYDNRLLADEKRTYTLFQRQQHNGFHLTPDIKNAQHGKKTAEEKRYLSGEWFEEYVYLRIKNDMNLEDNQIGRSVKIFRDTSGTNDNEIDVMFVKDNKLSMIECKIGITGISGPRNTIEAFQYKFAAIAKDFGLKINSYLFVLPNMCALFSDENLESIRKRNKILGITGIIDGPSMASSNLNEIKL